MNEIGRKKILIADDEPSVRQLLLRMLSNKYFVLEAGDGEEAVKLARSEQPDLVLMDLMMPKMDGYAACYAIKADPITKSIPVVMLTAIDHQLNVKLSKEIGADGYITKPFNSQELLDTIDQFLGGLD